MIWVDFILGFIFCLVELLLLVGIYYIGYDNGVCDGMDRQKEKNEKIIQDKELIRDFVKAIGSIGSGKND